MRRYGLQTIVLIAIVVFALVILIGPTPEVKMRAASYQLALQAYSQNLRLGLTRKDVEAYFRAGGVKFSQMGWLEEPEDRTALADLVKVGQEEAPWYCTEKNVYIAFGFAASGPHESWEVADTDVLNAILIFRRLDGCV